MKGMETQTIDGRKAYVTYLDDWKVVAKEKATLIKVMFEDNGQVLFLDAPEPKATKGAGTELLRKLRRGRALPAVTDTRKEAQRNLRTMTKVLVSFFQAIRPKLIAQAVRACEKIGKAEKDDLAMIDSVMAEIDFSVFNTLPARVQKMLENTHASAGKAALDTVGVAVKANKGAPELNPNAFNQVNDSAVTYAEHRSAELVGMKYVDGDLVPNPNAVWQITETTRDGIRNAVSEVVRGELPVTELADKLSQDYGFSSQRAEMIARTEVHKANGEGALAGYKASGVITQKIWLTSDDDDVSEECSDNEDEGPIDIDEEFQSGDMTEPAHPNCRCSIAPYVEWDTADEGEAA